ncbi:MAG: Gfo/Idh/MocA family protein, partial [Promethearchaeota archaeon]
MSLIRIGLASFAHIHAFSYVSVLKSMPNVEIVGFSDDHDTRAKRVQDQYALTRFGSHDELVSSKNVDLVLVTSETLYHEKIAIQAMENGKDVIVEKPIAIDLESARRMIEAEKKFGQRIFQCYPCRYHPSAKNIKKLIDAGEVGDILGITATNHGCIPDHEDSETAWFSSKKMAGGGAVMDHTTHVADLIFWFT